MGTKPVNRVPKASNLTCSNSTLTEWIKESSFFQANYKTLSTYLSTHTDLQVTDSLRSSANTGRCSTEELVALLALMRQELITLLTDMSAPDKGSKLCIDEQLATHSSRLNRLNQRAQMMISLLEN